LLDGLREGDNVFCDGLIRDLVNWQRTRSQAFQQLEKVLQLLSEPGEPLELGEPTRMLPDVRDFPTLKTGYGAIPFTKCSAGVQRIAGLAYLLVWMWDEHLRACEQRRLAPTRRIVVLVDEIECHLHPRWQRLVLPALLKAVGELTNGQVEVQMLISTHAPLVLASVEQLFDERRDALFHFESVRQRVMVSKVDWRAQGEADSWLTSEAFGLETPRSIPAEKAILKAMNAMKQAPKPEGIRKIHRDLYKVLGDTDPFWPRWRYFAEKNGMQP